MTQSNRFYDQNNPEYNRLVNTLNNTVQRGVDIEAAVASVLEPIRFHEWKQRGLKLKGRGAGINDLLSSKKDLLLPADDHGSLWFDKDKNPVIYVSQPYQLTLPEMRRLITFCDEHDLNVLIDAKHSWHYAGKTLFVQIRKNS